MDIKKLTIGQKLWMQSGNLRKEVEVAVLCKKYVDVEFIENERLCSIQFADGGKKQLGCTGYGPNAWDPRPVYGEKEIPWNLTDAFEQPASEQYRRTPIDIKKLNIGQEVSISCRYCIHKAKVVELTPEGVVVRTIRPLGDRFSATGFSVSGLLRFDSDGKGRYITETSDCPGPWYLEEITVDIKELTLGQNLYMRSGNLRKEVEVSVLCKRELWVGFSMYWRKLVW